MESQKNLEKVKEEVINLDIVPKVDVMAFIKRDFPYIVVCLAVLLVCGYVLWQLGDAQQSCNDYWTKQWEAKCIGPQKENMLVYGGEEYEHKDFNQDT